MSNFRLFPSSTHSRLEHPVALLHCFLSMSPLSLSLPPFLRLSAPSTFLISFLVKAAAESSYFHPAAHIAHSSSSSSGQSSSSVMWDGAGRTVQTTLSSLEGDSCGKWSKQDSIHNYRFSFDEFQLRMIMN